MSGLQRLASIFKIAFEQFPKELSSATLEKKTNAIALDILNHFSPVQLAQIQKEAKLVSEGNNDKTVILSGFTAEVQDLALKFAPVFPTMQKNLQANRFVREKLKNSEFEFASAIDMDKTLINLSKSSQTFIAKREAEDFRNKMKSHLEKGEYREVVEIYKLYQEQPFFHSLNPDIPIKNDILNYAALSYSALGKHQKSFQ